MSFGQNNVLETSRFFDQLSSDRKVSSVEVLERQCSEALDLVHRSQGAQPCAYLEFSAVGCVGHFECVGEVVAKAKEGMQEASSCARVLWDRIQVSIDRWLAGMVELFVYLFQADFWEEWRQRTSLHPPIIRDPVATELDGFKRE